MINISNYRFYVMLLVFGFAIILYMALSHGTVKFYLKKFKLVSLSTNSSNDKSETQFLLQPTVTIPSLGQVIGSFSSSSNGRKFSSFRGIPYAKPPIGKLRFKEPEPIEPWGLLNATDYGFTCMQLGYDDQMSEDCLTLNIFTHEINPGGSHKPAVLVYIHGGAFVGDVGSYYDPDYFLNDRDLVLVTINYRLGAFGFVSTGDSEAPGNYGLIDQSLALRWIRDHIGHFGGDPKSVTIMGHSAGGASVEYHMLSPLSKGLFDGAIAQSGSSLCNWAFSKEASVQNTKRLANDLNCRLSTSKEMIDCLRERNASEIVDSYDNDPLRRDFKGIPIGYWIPRVDTERDMPFLPAEPEEIIRGGKFNLVPFINGIASHEGSLLQSSFFGEKMEEFKQNHVKYIPRMCVFQYRVDRDLLAKMIYKHYFLEDPNIKDEIALEEMLSDCNFNKCVEDSIRLFSRYNIPNSTFHYLFDEQDPKSPLVGSHAGFQIFQFRIISPLDNEKDWKLSKMILDFWTSFATKRIPYSDLLSSRWIPVNETSAETDNVKSGFLKIKYGKALMVSGSMPFDRRLEYLDELFAV